MTDAAKLPLMLTELRMPTIGRLWQELGATADKEGWAPPASTHKIPDSPTCRTRQGRHTWPSTCRRWRC